MPAISSRAPDRRFSHVKCHYYQRLGHISRFCEKCTADMATQEELGAREKDRGFESPKVALNTAKLVAEG